MERNNVPSKEWNRLKRIAEYVRKKKEVPFAVVCNIEFIGLKTVYMLAQQIAMVFKDITYKKGKFIYNGG